MYDGLNKWVWSTFVIVTHSELIKFYALLDILFLYRTCTNLFTIFIDEIFEINNDLFDKYDVNELEIEKRNLNKKYTQYNEYIQKNPNFLKLVDNYWYDQSRLG